MKLRLTTKKEDKYYINEHQYFKIDIEKAKEELNKIKFPAIILDTEFVNQTYKRSNQYSDYNKEFANEDSVFVIQYSFAQNLKEISHRNNKKSINSLAIKRRIGDPDFDAQKQEKKLIKTFLNICINKRIKTIVLAGAANDKKIIESWINKYRALLNNKQSELFIWNETTNLYEINSYDVYDLLEASLAFANVDKYGYVDAKYNNYKKSKIDENMFVIPSLKTFSLYIRDLINYREFKELHSIYYMCWNILEFLTIYEIPETKFKFYSTIFSEAKKHCYNDVLKMLNLLDFVNNFANNDESENKYLRGEYE